MLTSRSPQARLTRIALIPVLLILVLFLDSRWFAQRFAYGQWAANVLAILYFIWMYASASSRLRRLMLIGLGVATAGEVVFSLWIGMYEYRFANVPVYVPPGHTILYAGVFQLIREPWFLRRAARLVPVLFATAAAFSVAWYALRNDLYGLLCFGVFACVYAATKESRPFFAVMYLTVAYLELIGTSFGCWYWHPTLLNRWDFIPSGNPPSGIAVFYFGFDIGCLGFYMLSDLKRRARYDSYKAFRKRSRNRGTSPAQAT